MCNVLKVSRSTYYRWHSCGPSNRVLENRLFIDLIKNVFENSRRTYVSPRLKAELNRQGYHISKRRVAKLAVFLYIEIWNNRGRLHFSLNYKTTKEVELEFNNLKYMA